MAIIDPEYNFPVSVRGFGSWGFKVSETGKVVSKVVGTLKFTDSGRIQKYFAGEVIQRFIDRLSKLMIEHKVSIFGIGAVLNDLSAYLQREISDSLKDYGIEISNFNIESVNIPEDEKNRIQNVLGAKMELDQLEKSSASQAYKVMKILNAMEKAADNPGGGAGSLLAGGIGLGVGQQLGKQFGKILDSETDDSKTDESSDARRRLQALKQLLDSGLISRQDYDEKKNNILDNI